MASNFQGNVTHADTVVTDAGPSGSASAPRSVKRESETSNEGRERDRLREAGITSSRKTSWSGQDSDGTTTNARDASEI